MGHFRDAKGEILRHIEKEYTGEAEIAQHDPCSRETETVTWLALSDFREPMFARSGLANSSAEPTSAQDGETHLKIGTFVIEARLDQSSSEAQVLLDHDEGSLKFHLSLSENDGIHLMIDADGHKAAYALTVKVDGRNDLLRITYSWDAAKNWGLMSGENLDTGALNQVELQGTPALRFSDVEAMSLGTQFIDSEDAVTYFGFSAGIEPVGLTACIAPHAPVDTPDGAKMIDQLEPGDQILTEDHGPQTVRWVGAREVPARGQFQPIRLRAPYFGLNRDLLVAPEQCLLIGGAEVEYLFGEEEVLVQARHLVNGVSALWEKTGPTVQLYHVLLDEHEVISISGCQLESLYVGSIGTDAALLQTTMLRGLAPEDVPIHMESARPILRNYEAITLQSVLTG